MAGSVTVSPTAGMPTSVDRALDAGHVVGLRPSARGGRRPRSVKSAPRPPVSARTCSTGSAAAGSTVWVAPAARLASRRGACGSTATIVAAPAMRAPWITDWPTPPQPITATLAPGVTPAVLNAAPSPVVTPHPRSASSSSGRSVSTATTEASSTTIASRERAAAAHRRRRPAVGEPEPRRRLDPPAQLAVVGHPVDAPPARPAGGRHHGQDPVADAARGAPRPRPPRPRRTPRGRARSAAGARTGRR